MKRAMRLGALVLGLTSCGDPLVAQQVLEKTRILAARVEVDGEPARATPRVGETAIVRFLVAGPAETAPLGWALAACPRLDVSSGVPGCAGPVFATSRVAVSSAPPSLLMTVDHSFEVTEQLLVFGVICEGGAPEVVMPFAQAWPDRVGCEMHARATLRVSLDLPAPSTGTINQNPDLGPTTIAIDGDPWPPSGPQADCTGGEGLPRHSARVGDRVIEITLPSSSRESVEAERETMTVSAFSTDGKLDRVFSVIESDDPEPASVSTVWSPPAAVSKRDRLVRFYFVVRDGRGGADWAERALCVEGE